MDSRQLAAVIDQVALGPTVTTADVTSTCALARKYGFKGVAVPPCYLSLAARLLKGTSSVVVAPVGFPMGNTSTESKVLEAEQAMGDGARELDVVMNIGKLKEGDYRSVDKELSMIADIDRSIPVKVIIEGCYLTRDEIVEACKLTMDAGAAFVKSSTGFGLSGATPEMVKLMLATVEGRISVKAAGGISTIEQVERYISMGVKRIGTSRGGAVMDAWYAKSRASS